MFTPIKEISKKCLECCSGSYKEVRSCQVTGCSLYIYRFMMRPKKEEKSQADLEPD